jgi:dihydroorotase
MNLLVAGGLAVDPATRSAERLDVEIGDGRITALGRDLPVRPGGQIIDAHGCYVSPGLIDFHLHSYWGVNPYSLDVDAVCLGKGVTTAVDAGSSGPVNFSGFKRLISERSRTRMLAFVCVAQHGVLRSPGELVDIGFADPEGAAQTVAGNLDVAVGIKVRLQDTAVGVNGRKALQLAMQAGEASKSPVMVHVGPSSMSMEEIADSLRPCDIITHCFSPLPPSIVDTGGRLRKAVLRARERGVLFDVGHGGRHLNFELVRSAMSEGLRPDILSTDIHTRITSTSIDMPQVMTKLLALGMTPEDVLAACTSRPSKAIGWQDRLGTLEVGREADVTVVQLQGAPVVLRDSNGAELLSERRFAIRCTIRAGELVQPLPSSLDGLDRADRSTQA